MKVRFSKSLLSVILALVMVISMFAVGIVNVSSAKVDVSTTGDSVIEVWFTRPNSWGNNPNVHYWGGASSSSWPGKAMTWKYNNDYGQGVYYTTIPGDSNKIIFNNGNGSHQTVDISISGSIVAYYTTGAETGSSVNVKAWDKTPDSLLEPITYSLTIDTSSVDVTSGTAAVSLPAGTHIYFVLKKQGSESIQVKKGAYTAAEAGTYKVTYDISANTCTFTKQDPVKVYLADATADSWVGNDDAVVTVNGTEMTKSVDEHTGWNVWVGSVVVNSGETLTYKRVSKIDSADVFNTWTTTYDPGSPCYCVKDDDQSANGAAPTIPTGKIDDFWYGIWVDTKGNGDKKDCVKLYASNLYSSTDYYLYLPSYVDRSAVKLYTSLYDLKIDSVSVPRATATTVNLSQNSYNLSFKRYEGGSTHYDFKLHVMKTTGVSAMLLTTKVELYTGLTAAYAANEDGSANYEGAAAYKESTSTKGDYLVYDAEGNCLNPTDKETGALLTGLKKIKGRGNSTFEASMRLFGKYAYNITLTDKAALIPGAVAQKKYSMLANNADESLMRNVTVYGIADAVGMPYTPNTRLVDLFDNGSYLGAYVLTEKVEYGKNTLISDAKSLDKFNEDVLAVGKGIDYDALKQKTATYTAKSGTTYTYQYNYTAEAGKTYEFDGSTVTIGEGDDAETYTLDETTMKKYDFLLEHELETRYKPEATWFKSSRTGQAVVPKYPEFATQKEVQWMIEQYDALEDAVYDGDYARLCEVADVETFADVYLIQEITMNLDAAATSYNILGGKSFPKLKAAPLWDYDWAAGMYNGKKLTTDGEVDVSDTSKWFVTKKSVKIDSADGRTQSIPNLQAKMTQMTSFWTLCKKEWTNDFIPVLSDYLGDGKTLLGSTLSEFRSAAAMNESRWHARQKIKSGAHAEDPMAFTWGTRSTSEYKKGSYAFSASGSQGYYASGAADNYDNTVYYLNDWLTKRRETMSTTFGLYDASLIVQPTEPPTEPPTEAPTEAPPITYYYILGDVDGNGAITIMDATALQRVLAELDTEQVEGKLLRGKIVGETAGIMDVTAIQRYLAQYTDTHGIGSLREYTVPAA